MENNIILGLPSVAKFRNKDLVNQSIRRRIIHSFPNGSAPLTAILAWCKNQPITDTQHQWFEKIHMPPRIVCRGNPVATSTEPSAYDSDDSGTALAAGAKTTATPIWIKVQTTGLVAENDVIRVGSWDVPLRVVGVVGASNGTADKGYIKVLPLRAFTYATANALTADQVIDIIGSAYAEGSGSGAARGLVYPTRILNQTQIFKEPFEITGSAGQVDMEYDNTGAYKEMSQDASRFHFEKIEKALIFGQRTTTTDASGKEIRTMSGIIEFLKLWDAGDVGLTIDGSPYAPYNFKGQTTSETDQLKRYIPNTDGKISIDRLERWLRNINMYANSKSAERLVVCGSGVMLAMSKAMRDQGSYQWEVGQSMFGTNFNKLVTSFGNINFLTHPLFNENPLYQNSALFLDVWSLNFRPLQNRDTALIKNIQANDADSRKDQWRTEATLEFWNPCNHLFVENISTYDKTAE